MRGDSNVCVRLDSQVQTAMIRTPVIPILVITELPAEKKEIILNVLVEEDTLENNARWLTVVCQILVSMVAPAWPRMEGSSAHALQTTEEQYATRENHVIPTLVAMRENAFQLRKDLFADARLDIEEKLVQRKMNANQIHVKMAADV